MQDGVRTCDQYDSILADHPGEMTWRHLISSQLRVFLKGKKESDFHCTFVSLLSQ